MAEIPFEPYTGQGKLRFWCQKVLPLVYDESLSYYELLNKVVDYLNNTIDDVSACEDNITALRDAFVQLQDYVNEQLEDFAPEVERIIDEMVDSGEFGEILTDVVNGLIAGEYNTTQGYAQFDYVLKDGKLYCATASTSGEWDATKWRETTVGADMQLLNQRVYNLNAGQVAFNESVAYDDNTVGKKLKDLDDFDDNLNAGQVAYNSENTYNNATVGKELQELKGSLNLLSEKRYIFIGDSYGAQADSWIDYVINNLGLTLGSNAFKVAQASTGFIGDPNLSGDYTWKTLLTNASGTITNHDTITDIIICGGANDRTYSDSQLLTAMTAFVDYVNTEYPNAKIHLGMIARTKNISWLGQIATTGVRYRNNATACGINFIINSTAIWGGLNNFNDNLHPNATATRNIATAISVYILSGICPTLDTYGSFSATKTGILSDASNLANNSMSQTASAGLCLFSIQTLFRAEFSSAVNIVCNDNWQDLLTLPNLYVLGGGSGITAGNMQIYSPSEGIYHKIPCTYRIYDGKLQARLSWKGATGTADKTISTTQIKFDVPIITMTMSSN